MLSVKTIEMDQDLPFLLPSNMAWDTSDEANKYVKALSRDIKKNGKVSED